jgi:hypothetical protein
MTVVLANLTLAIPFLVAFIAIPLWMTFKHPDTGADHTQARRYLRARAAREHAGLTQAAHAKAA